MKRYLISNTDIIQNVSLEKGTYTLVVYVKNMYSPIYSFSLFNSIEDEVVFDVDVVQGEWCKVYHTFYISEKKTKFNLTKGSFPTNGNISVYKPQLAKGNAISETGASPLDVEVIVDNLQNDIGRIRDFTDDEFADRFIDESEKVSLLHDLQNIQMILNGIDVTYLNLKSNSNLNQQDRDLLTTAYDRLQETWNGVDSQGRQGLKTVIQTIISKGGKISQEDIDKKDFALLAFNNALTAYGETEILLERKIVDAIASNTAMSYMAGVWSPSVVYTRDEVAYPVVALIGETRVDYYFLKVPFSTRGLRPTDVGGDVEWESVPSFNMVISEAIFGNFAKLGSAVFKGDHMISQYGENEHGDSTYEYENFEQTASNGKPKFTPNIHLNFRKGEASFINASMKNAAIEGATITDAVVDGLLKVSSGYEGFIGDYNLYFMTPKSQTQYTMPEDMESEGKIIKFYNSSDTVTHALLLPVIGYKDSGSYITADRTLNDSSKGARKDAVDIPPRSCVEVSCFRLPDGNYYSESAGASEYFFKVLSWEMTNREIY